MSVHFYPVVVVLAAIAATPTGHVTVVPTLITPAAIVTHATSTTGAVSLVPALLVPEETNSDRTGIMYVPHPLLVPAAPGTHASGPVYVVPVLLDTIGNAPASAFILHVGSATPPALLVPAAPGTHASGPVYVVHLILVLAEDETQLARVFVIIHALVDLSALVPNHLHIMPTLLVPAASGTDPMALLRSPLANTCTPAILVAGALMSMYLVPVLRIPTTNATVSLGLVPVHLLPAVHARAAALLPVFVLHVVVQCHAHSMDIDDPDHPMADDSAPYRLDRSDDAMDLEDDP